MAENGNGAAMREALNQLRDWALLDINENAIRPDEPNYKKLVDGIVEITNAALAAPPRNCDRFADETDAQIAFLNEVWLISVTKETALERDRFENWTDKMRSRYARWLFAPATEREGGNNEDN